MAVESGEQGDPSSARAGQSGRRGESDQADRAANRRRIIIASLLTPPAVMTLGSPAARAQSSVSKSAMTSRDPHHHDH
jgi:hypothetical protein